MSFDLRRFQFLLGTDCECQNLTYVDEVGAHILQVSCCSRCWEMGMMKLQSDAAQQSAEIQMIARNDQLDLLMDYASK